MALRAAHCALFELTCEETRMLIRFNTEHVTPRLLRSATWRLQLGDDHAAQRGPSCRATGGPWTRTGGTGGTGGPGTTGDLPIVLHAGLQECGTESTKTEGEWAAAVPVVGAHDLHGDYAAPRSSSPFQLGSLVILEASVEAPGHPSLRLYADRCVVSPSPYPLDSPGYDFITNHGCLVPGSPSAFLKQTRDDRLRFVIDAAVGVTAKEDATMLYIGCHLSVTLAGKPADSLHKACFLHGPTFSWRTVDEEGSSDVCACCRF
ncbi:hypothetical protein CRUP_011554 [Coryphaenoides rupestris]|nr:hypothetical protein CRUP_011554 [Coryphaenoides rupestris]